MFINIQNLITLRIIAFSPKYQFFFCFIRCLIAIFVPKYKVSTPLIQCGVIVPPLCCFNLCNSVKSWGVEVNPHKSQFVLPFKI